MALLERLIIYSNRGKLFLKPRYLKIQQLKNSISRPITPEEKQKKCLNCANMEDFIKGLQQEIKRLQNLTNDLTMQLILAGVNPQMNQNNSSTQSQEQKFQNICPLCTNQKVHQRPNTATRMRSDSGIRIRKTNAIQDRKKQVIEKELEFVEQLKRDQQQQIIERSTNMGKSIRDSQTFNNKTQYGNTSSNNYLDKQEHMNSTMSNFGEGRASMPPIKKKVSILAQLPPLNQNEVINFNGGTQSARQPINQSQINRRQSFQESNQDNSNR
eukprot:403339461